MTMLYRSPAYPGLRLRSLARTYQPGVSVVTTGRPDLLYIRINNRGGQAVYFWHGPIPSGPTGTGAFLPEDPADWTVQQTADAETLLNDYGEKISPGAFWEPTVAHTGIVYSYVAASTNNSHVVVGFQEDQEQGIGSLQER